MCVLSPSFTAILRHEYTVHIILLEKCRHYGQASANPTLQVEAKAIYMWLDADKLILKFLQLKCFDLALVR